MNRKKQIIYTAAGILFICLLFMAAVVSPEYFKDYTDKQLFNKTEYITARYDAYEVTYTSFAEKIRAIGRITNSGTGYNSVKINDADFDYKYINKIIRKEFNTLYKCGVLGKKIRLRAKKMVSCEKYMLYPSVEKSNLKGISFIKAVYKFKNGKVSTNCAKCGHLVGSAPYPIARTKDYLLIDSKFEDKCSHCGNELKNHIISKRPESWIDPRQSDLWSKDYTNIPKCPICGSTNIKKISMTNKAVSALAFGVLAAGHVSKTWKCEVCNSKF